MEQDIIPNKDIKPNKDIEPNEGGNERIWHRIKKQHQVPFRDNIRRKRKEEEREEEENQRLGLIVGCV